MGGIGTGAVLTEGLGGVQVAKARCFRQAGVVGVEVALRPAEMIRNLAKIGLQGGARQGELFGDAGVFFGGLDQIPARMSVRMAMKLDDTIIAHGLDFAPAQYNLVATPLLDTHFAVAMLRRFRQLALPHTMPRSEEHTSELQSLIRNSYAVFCLKKKK